MARIRSIKPEFPLSETVGVLSRDARLCFILLWTIVDDEGRARAASRMLASLLYPYDDDAPSLIDGWLAELEAHECIRRYDVDGSTYLDIPKWLKHQKIDKPSKSKLPPFDGQSRGLANNREASMLEYRSKTLDLGPRTRDQNLAETNLSGCSTDTGEQADGQPEPYGDDSFGPAIHHGLDGNGYDQHDRDEEFAG
ncbi:hypothetical protein [Methylobacterium sp. E-045]|uniref:hypothetical protein n=1 Tax=Methylobacterium sp. E-045 TaxID=2836575 RepID=UPI001FBB9A0D|nr:hypothetical protein [Methylobacterium sp. E-045]MCJ2132209.1 hypothetical protein [Methylobacterium sp. E-045]